MEDPIARRAAFILDSDEGAQIGGGRSIQAGRDEFVLAVEKLVHRALGHLGRSAECLHSDAHALLVQQVVGSVEQPVSRLGLAGRRTRRHAATVRQPLRTGN